MKFLLFSEFGELLDLAVALQNEGHEVKLHIPNHEYAKIGDGIVKKEKEWWTCVGEGYIWCFDGCTFGGLQDWLRGRGESVFGGSDKGDKLENDRQLGQALFKAAGFKQPESKNFKDIDEAIAFVKENNEKRWILKQNGDAPKSLNHMGKFDGGKDMVFHLEELKKGWSETEFGKFDCDLMEVVEGLEVAASAFFNGTDFLKNKDGKVVGFLNFEEKKEGNGQTGETTGEMGTTFLGVTEDNSLFKDILLKPKIREALKAIGFRGVFDINCIKTKEGIVALEPTCRFGVPATSYEFMEGLESPLGELIATVAAGETKPVTIKMGLGMVMVVVAKPYPLEVEVSDEGTSIGERLWILQDGKPVKDFSDEQKKHIHLENFYKDEGVYKVATKNGYLLTVTGRGKTISEVRESLVDYIKKNLYISGMKYRTDIGQRVEEATGIDPSSREKRKYDAELSKLKEVIRKTIYED